MEKGQFLKVIQKYWKHSWDFHEVSNNNCLTYLDYGKYKKENICFHHVSNFWTPFVGLSIFFKSCTWLRRKEPKLLIGEIRKKAAKWKNKMFDLSLFILTLLMQWLIQANVQTSSVGLLIIQLK